MTKEEKNRGTRFFGTAVRIGYGPQVALSQVDGVRGEPHSADGLRIADK